MIIYNGDELHLILLPCNITKDKFLQQAKVRKGSYFYNRLESIYTALTETTTNLEYEYIEYYSEYDSFAIFLNHKYPVLDDVKIELIHSYLKTKKYNLFRGYFHNLCDYNFYSLFDVSDEFVEKINNLLRAELYED
jgi:hypothetical protein